MQTGKNPLSTGCAQHFQIMPLACYETPWSWCPARCTADHVGLFGSCCRMLMTVGTRKVHGSKLPTPPNFCGLSTMRWARQKVEDVFLQTTQFWVLNFMCSLSNLWHIFHVAMSYCHIFYLWGGLFLQRRGSVVQPGCIHQGTGADRSQRRGLQSQLRTLSTTTCPVWELQVFLWWGESAKWMQKAFVKWWATWIESLSEIVLSPWSGERLLTAAGGLFAHSKSPETPMRLTVATEWDFVTFSFSNLSVGGHTWSPTEWLDSSTQGTCEGHRHVLAIAQGFSQRSPRRTSSFHPLIPQAACRLHMVTMTTMFEPLAILFPSVPHPALPSRFQAIKEYHSGKRKGDTLPLLHLCA